MDQHKKKKSERAESFKRRSTIVEKRALRAHRRSMEWKQLRDDTVSQQRRIDPTGLSPLKEQSPPKVKKEHTGDCMLIVPF